MYSSSEPGKPFRYFFQPNHSQDALQVIARGIESPDSEVVSDGSVKEYRLRRQLADGRTQARKRHGTDVYPRDEDPA